MTPETEKSAERSSAPQTGNQSSQDNTNRIKQAPDDCKAIHEALTRSPHEWRSALRQAGLPASALLVGLALVDEFLNRKTGRCFPSFEAIAISCRITSIRTIRAGVEALRKAGLISTRKTKFDGSLSYWLRLPDGIRSGINMSLRADGEAAVLCPTKGQKSDARSDRNLPPNLRKEPLKVTAESHSVPSDPDGGAFGTVCSPFGRTPSSLSASLGPTDELFLEMEIEVDDTQLHNLEYVRAWLKTNCPDREHIRPIMRLAAINELTKRHLMEIAS